MRLRYILDEKLVQYERDIMRGIPEASQALKV